MTQARDGDTVRVHYTGRLEDGTVFDSSKGREPLEFTIGSGVLIPGFERTVLGMAPGETRAATLPPHDAYGERDEENVVVLERTELPEGMAPGVGDMLEVHGDDGSKLPVIVTETTASSVTLDANHPLAGKTLRFEIELVGIGPGDGAE
jgi:FKBP-type peptidyl-prolyl cis-trans isomerase 2